MPTQIEAGLERRLADLSSRQGLAFAAALCERLMPNYRLYADMEGEGDVHSVRTLLDLIWEALGVRDARIDFSRQAQKLIECEPPDADERFGARAAGDLTLALSACLDDLIAGSGEAPIEVSRLSLGSVERFIELQAGEAVMDDTRREALIESHELIADERAFQKAVLEALETAPLDRPRLRTIRALGRNEGFSNLGISLEAPEGGQNT